MAANVAIEAAGLLGFSLLVAHTVADHWVQTDAQARNKGLPGWPGRRACAAHVASYTATLLVFVLALMFIFRLPLSPEGIALGLLVSAVSHYWADRRFTLARFCEHLGRGNFYRLGQPRNLEAQEYILTSGHRVVRLFEPESKSKSLISWDNPNLGTGAYALDQSWHWFWIFVTTIVMVVL